MHTHGFVWAWSADSVYQKKKLELLLVHFKDSDVLRGTSTWQKL